MADDVTTNQFARLCDATGLPTWFIKGRGAESWLGDQGCIVSAETYATTLTSDEARVTRTGSDEFLIESAAGGIHQLHRNLVSHDISPGDCFVVQRQDAVYCLTGVHACDVMSQTCAINWNEVPAETLVMTQVAGVSCGVRRRNLDDVPCYVLRVDPTYGAYLWEQLLTICTEQGGGVVDVAKMYPELG